MKNRDLKLERLFAAARSAPAPAAADELSAHLQTRVLAHWRSASEADAGWLSLASLFRTALACAGLAMLLCVAWNQLDSASVDYSASSYTDAQSDESVNALRNELIP
jgi:hypothetical protein